MIDDKKYVNVHSSTTSCLQINHYYIHTDVIQGKILYSKVRKYSHHDSAASIDVMLLINFELLLM